MVWSAFPQLSNLVFPHTPHCQLPEHVSKNVNKGESVCVSKHQIFLISRWSHWEFSSFEKSLSANGDLKSVIFAWMTVRALHGNSFPKIHLIFLETQRCYFRSVISRWDGNVFSFGLKTWYFRSIEEGSTLTIPTSKQDFLLIRVLILPFCLNSSNWIEYVCQNIHFNMRSQYTHWQKRITFKYQRKSLVSYSIQYKRCSTYIEHTMYCWFWLCLVYPLLKEDLSFYHNISTVIINQVFT